MAFSEVYVDPSIAADSGTGTIGDPYGDLEYAIEQTTFDTTNGTRVNIKAGTAEVLAGLLNTAMDDTVTTPAWVPTGDAPCIFQGYNTVAGDGGMASIDCNGAECFTDATKNYIHFVNLHVYNGTTVSGVGMISVNDACKFIRCEFGPTGRGIDMDSGNLVKECYFHDLTLTCILDAGSGSVFEDNYVVAAAGQNGIQCRISPVVRNNIIIVSGAGSGIYVTDPGGHVENNSVYCSDAGTGNGIYTLASVDVPFSISNNLVEGFSGAGGVGIKINAVTSFVRGNAAYNCTTAFTLDDTVIEEDNEVLTASPFNDAANGDFSPVDTGNVLEGALPQIIGLP